MRPRLVGRPRACWPTRAIFVSIDDHEVAHLRLLMDDVFGEANLLATVVVNLNAEGTPARQGLRDEPRVPAGLRPRRRELRARRDVHLHGRPGRLPAHAPTTAASSATCRCATPTRSSTRRPRRTLHFPVYGDPATGAVRTTPFEGAEEIWPVFGDGRPAVWRWSRPLIDERPDDLVCRAIAGRTGPRVDVFQRDWLHPVDRSGGPPQEAAHHLARRGGRLDRHRGRGAEGRSSGHVFESPKPTGLLLRILETMPDDVRRPRLLRRQRDHRSRGGAGQRGRRRHPALPVGQLRRAHPPGLQRRTGRSGHRRRHHPRPAARGRRVHRRRPGGALDTAGCGRQGWSR